MSPWIIKHQPKKICDIEGQQEAVQQMRNFVAGFGKKGKRAAILFGPVGCGKTCSVYALANELGYEVLEVNASDVRNKAAINDIVGSASKQRSLFARSKIILVDEVEGIAGRNDFGGVAALASLIAETSFPIIMTCNDPFDSKFSSLRSKSNLIEFKNLDSKAVFNALKRVADREKLAHDESALKAIALRSGGDLRAAVNDLQTFSILGKLANGNVDEISQREKEESIVNAMMKVLKTTDPEISAAAFDNVQEDFDQRFLWLDENIPKEYLKPEDLCRAYESLSKASVFSGRIRRWQYWRFLVYVNALQTAGVSVAKDEKYRHFVKYGPTQRILKIWQANMKYQKRKAIAEKIAVKNHCSKKRAVKDVFPYVQEIFHGRNKQMKDEFQKYFEFDEEEVMWMKR